VRRFSPREFCVTGIMPELHSLLASFIGRRFVLKLVASVATTSDKASHRLSVQLH